MRRSIAQNYIKHFTLLGVDPFLIADVMLYAIEIAQTFSGEKQMLQETFYKSMLTSFHQAIKFMIAHGLIAEFKLRIIAISQETDKQNWYNKLEFLNVVDRFEY